MVDTFGKLGEGAKSVLDAIAESALQSFPWEIGRMGAALRLGLGYRVAA